MKKFEVGKTYFARSNCDWDCIYSWKVISRTEKTVTLEDTATHAIHRRKLLDNRYNPNAEWCLPKGSYSMCPVIDANDDFLKD